jgi:hypothetical protein
LAGTPWSDDEVSAVVASYLRMLAWERTDVAYNKAESRRRLITTVHRSEDSIERKLQNISAVLGVWGPQWINGHNPPAHYRDALVAAVGYQRSNLFACFARCQSLIAGCAIVAAAFDSPAVAAGLDDVAMVRQAVEQRRCHGIAEHAGPFAERKFGGEDDGRALVQPADEVERQLAGA